MSYCPRCGTAADPGSPTCPACGAPLPGPAKGGEKARTGPRRAYLTELATKACDLADTFNLMFEEPFVGWRAEVAKPGMSTAGGKQALQHIGLLAQGGGTLVIGHIDQSTNQAEIRTYERVDTMHRERFHSPFPIAPEDWDSFATKVARFLRTEGFTITLVDTGVSRRPRTASRGVPVLWVLLGGILIAAVAVAVTLLVLRYTP